MSGQPAPVPVPETLSLIAPYLVTYIQPNVYELQGPMRSTDMNTTRWYNLEEADEKNPYGFPYEENIAIPVGERSYDKWFILRMDRKPENISYASSFRLWAILRDASDEIVDELPEGIDLRVGFAVWPSGPPSRNAGTATRSVQTMTQTSPVEWPVSRPLQTVGDCTWCMCAQLVASTAAVAGSYTPIMLAYSYTEL